MIAASAFASFRKFARPASSNFSPASLITIRLACALASATRTLCLEKDGDGMAMHSKIFEVIYTPLLPP